MMFKKDGKLYGSIESVVDEHCQKQRYCFQCVLYRKRGTKCCEHYAHTNPEKVAHLLGFEVIEDTLDIREVVEHHGEDVKRYSVEMRQYLDEMRRYENWRYGNDEEKESQPIPNTGDAGRHRKSQTRRNEHGGCVYMGNYV